MNLNAEMIPGLCLLIAGAVIGFGAKPICRREQNIPQVKLLDVGRRRSARSSSSSRKDRKDEQHGQGV